MGMPPMSGCCKILFLKLVCIQSPAISQLPFKYPYLMLVPTVVSAVSHMCSLYLPILKILSHLFCDLYSLVYLKELLFFSFVSFFVFVLWRYQLFLFLWGSKLFIFLDLKLSSYFWYVKRKSSKKTIEEYGNHILES